MVHIKSKLAHASILPEANSLPASERISGVPFV